MPYAKMVDTAVAVDPYAHVFLERSELLRGVAAKTRSHVHEQRAALHLEHYKVGKAVVHRKFCH
jgi:hypothetical protein